MAVFVAEFADGQTTRMSTFMPRGKLDLGRGIRVARHAHNQRTGKSAGRIVAAHYEDNSQDGQPGAVLRTYSAAELDAAQA